MLCLQARAKINWTLDILAKRADGYHLMDMLMQSVALCDTLWLEPARELELCSGEPETAMGQPGEEGDRLGAKAVPFDQSNLVYRAALALRQAAGTRQGARMTLEKRIPSGAGMGGGSADAAAALVGLDRLWGLGLSPEELRRIGLGLGADIPFTLTGGLARVGGIGEKLQPLSPAPTFWLALTQPCGGLSTGEIFSAFDRQGPEASSRPQTEQAQAALLKGDVAALGRAMGNVLEPISAAGRPAIAGAIRQMEAFGAQRAMMTGSGSVVYGLFASEAAARAACQKGRQEAGGYWQVTHTVARPGFFPGEE